MGWTNMFFANNFDRSPYRRRTSETWLRCAKLLVQWWGFTSTNRLSNQFPLQCTCAFKFDLKNYTEFTVSILYFPGPTQLWAYFYGPIAILLSLNIIYLGLTGWRLWHQYRDYSGNKLRALRFKCMLYIKLIFVMGITWIFEVLSYAEDSKNNFWYLYICSSF